MLNGGAQNLRRGDRIQVKLDSSYHYYLNGLVGTVTAVYAHGVAVALEGDPIGNQRVLGSSYGTGDQTFGPVGKVRSPQRILQYHEVVRIDPAPPAC